jgi:hypothetical protein
MRFRRQTDELEAKLRARRREPRDEFVDAIVDSVSAEHARPKRQVVLGVAAAAVGITVFGAFGGLSYASSASHSVVDAVSPIIRDEPSTSKSSTGGSGGSLATSQSSTPSKAQYTGTTTICHRTSAGNYTLITTSQSSLPAHMAHGDVPPGPGGTCPGPPIP